MIFKGAFLDLDGTLLNKQHVLSNKTIETLRRLSSRGFLIGIATGRSSVSALHFLDQLNLDQSKAYIVCFNGSVGIEVTKSTIPQSPSTPKYLFNLTLTENQTWPLLRLADELGLVAQYYNGLTGEVQAFPKTDTQREYLKIYAEMVGRVQTIRSYEDAMKISLPAKILIMTPDPESLLLACQSKLSTDNYHIINGSPQKFVEFLPAGICKGEGFCRVCEYMGISSEEMVTFGDGENDKEMLSFSGCGVAMKNAVPMAKEASNIVCQVCGKSLLICMCYSYVLLYGNICIFIVYRMYLW